MSKRNAANFPTVSSGRHYKRPPTKAEEFTEYLKSLGYQVPKYTKPEHFEYLFQKSESAACIKFLMSKIKPKNVVDPEKLKIFKTLEAEGKMLYGADLENAMTKAKAKIQMEADKNEALAKKRKEIQEIIDAKKENIARLKRLEEQIDVSMALKQKEESLETYDEEYWTKKSEFLDTKIDVQLKELVEQVKALNSNLEEMMTHFSLNSNEESSPNPSSTQICQQQQDLKNMLAGEEKLMSHIRPLIDDCGTGLMAREHAEVDPIMIEEMNNLFNQNIKGIDRLKHVIIYEAIKKLELSAKLAADKAMISKWPELVDEAKRIQAQEPLIQQRMIAEIVHKKELLKKTLDDVRKQKRKRIKTVLANGLDGEIKVLKDIKQQARMKVDKFFAFVIDVLVSQRSRFEFGGFMMKYQAGKVAQLEQHYKQYLELLKHLNEFEESCDPEILEEKLSNTHASMYQVFEAYGIPFIALESHDSTWMALREIQHHLDSVKLEKRDLNEKQVRTNLKHLTEKHMDLDKTWKLVRKEQKKNSEGKLVEELEANIAAMKARLTDYALNRDTIREESIARKRSLIQDIYQLLAESDEEITNAKN